MPLLHTIGAPSFSRFLFKNANIFSVKTYIMYLCIFQYVFMLSSIAELLA